MKYSYSFKSRQNCYHVYTALLAVQENSLRLRGLRQEEPLSPFIFVVVVDSLNRMMDRALKVNLSEGISVGRDQVMVSHLQLADDTRRNTVLKVLLCSYH